MADAEIARRANCRSSNFFGSFDGSQSAAGDGLGKVMEDTIAEMERLGPEQWAKLLDMARSMRGKAE